MSSESASGVGQNKSLGVWALVSGVASLVGVLMIGQASWMWIPSFDPPGWMRIVTGWMMPVGAIAAGILGARSVARRAGRGMGIAGIALAVVAVAVFVGMLVTHPY